MSYQVYFAQVLLKRLRYVNKIAIVLAFWAAFCLHFPYTSIWWNIASLSFRVPVLFVALWLVKLGRNSNSTVDYARQKTLGQHIMHSVFTRRYIVTALFYLGLSYIIYGVFVAQLALWNQYYVLSKEYRHKPAINDEWVYYWFHAYFVAVLYTAQQLVFQRNRLQLKYGINSVKPEKVLFSNVPTLFGNSIAFTALSTVGGPVVYFIGRAIIYKVNWLVFALLSLDSAIPPFRIGFGTLLNVSFVTFFVFFLWEIVNHVYDIYATIGCLDGTKPISSYSADPINTLLSGLRDVEPEHQLSRLTAFQELAYIATTKDAEGETRRNAIYNTSSKGAFVWPAILDECALVIKDVSSRVNYRTKADMDALLNTQWDKDKPQLSILKPERYIFGNSFDMSTDTTQVSATSSPIKKYEAGTKVSNLSKLKQLAIVQLLEKQVLVPARKAIDGFLKPSSKPPTSIAQKVEQIRKFYALYHKQFLESSFGIFFRITIKRDAELRVVNAVNYGNAVIALAGLLVHAVEEDRSYTVTNNHISEVLNLFERPIRACANYTDILPASVYLSPSHQADEHKTKQHLVALLHDLTMHEFFQLCVKHNYKLNDLLLLSRAFKLAKWVIDASIAQQQKQTHSQAQFL